MQDTSSAHASGIGIQLTWHDSNTGATWRKYGMSCKEGECFEDFWISFTVLLQNYTYCVCQSITDT